MSKSENELILLHSRISVAYFDVCGACVDLDEAVKRERMQRSDAGIRMLQEESEVFTSLPMSTQFWPVYNALKDRGVSVRFIVCVGEADEESKNARRQWVREHMGSGAASFFFMVRHWKEKAFYAHANALLVDADPNSVQAFIEHGGQGILYSNAQQTLDILNNHFARHTKQEFSGVRS